MRTTGIVLALLVTIGLLQPATSEAGGKEVTLTGKIMCAKCELKETAKCTTAIRVTEGGKAITYYFVDKGAGEEYHEAVCGSGQQDGKVTGVVSEKSGKKYITPSKVVYATKGAMLTPHGLDDVGGGCLERAERTQSPVLVATCRNCR